MKLPPLHGAYEWLVDEQGFVVAIITYLTNELDDKIALIIYYYKWPLTALETVTFASNYMRAVSNDTVVL